MGDMRKIITLIILLTIIFGFNVRQTQSESLPELLRQCRAGDREACQEIYYRWYLLPRLEDDIGNLMPEPVIVLPLPQPDPPPIIEQLVEIREISHLLLGDPSPQPNIVNIEDQLKTTIKFRDALQNTIKSLDEDINSLKQKQKMKK